VFQHENSRKPLEPPVVAEFVKGSKPGPGHRTVFSEDFGLEEYDSVAYNKPLAGSHSGFVTTLRIAKANDRLYQKGSYLLQYEGVYRFNAVPNTPLMRGQVTARGVLYGTLDSKGNFTPLDGPIKVAITGGTDAYVTAHGEITERQPKLENRLLDISL
jgi:hypothetical protein